MDVIFKTENGTKSLQPPEEQKKLEKEKLNKLDETVYNDNKEKMDEDKMFDEKLNKLEDNKTRYRAGPGDKSKMLDKLEQEQKELSVIVIKKKVEETKL